MPSEARRNAYGDTFGYVLAALRESSQARDCTQAISRSEKSIPGGILRTGDTVAPPTDRTQLAPALSVYVAISPISHHTLRKNPVNRPQLSTHFHIWKRFSHRPLYATMWTLLVLAGIFFEHGMPRVDALILASTPPTPSCVGHGIADSHRVMALESIPVSSRIPIFEPHPLFPREALKPGEEELGEFRDIHVIEIHRWDHEGRKETCPRRVPAPELTSWEQVVNQYGGGTYQLRAYSRVWRHSASTEHPETGEAFFSPEPCRPFWTPKGWGAGAKQTPATRPAVLPAPAPPPPVVPLPAPPPRAPSPPAARPGESFGEKFLLEAIRMQSEQMTRLLSTVAAVSHAAPPTTPADPIATATALAEIAPSFGRGRASSVISEFGAFRELQKRLKAKDDESDPLMRVLTAKLAGDVAQAPAKSTAAAVPSPHAPASVPQGLVPVLHPSAGVVVYMPREKAAA